MQTIDVIIISTACLLSGLFFGYLFFCARKICINGRYVATHTTDERCPQTEFSVVGIKKVFPNNSTIAQISEYELIGAFFKDTGTTDSLSLYMYDKSGKYNIGDRFMFTKV